MHTYPHSSASPRPEWVNRLVRLAQRIGWMTPTPPAVVAPPTRRQQLLAAQDLRKAQRRITTRP